MKIAHAVLLATACFVLAGCGTPQNWYQPGVSDDQTRRDLAQCTALANLATPSGSGIFVPGPGAGWAMLGQGMSQNGQRKDLIRDCMIAKGYQLYSGTNIASVTQPKVWVDVTAFHKPLSFQGSSFEVIGETNVNSLEGETYCDVLRTGLVAKGLVHADYVTNADYIFFLRYKRITSGFSVRIEAAAEKDIELKSDENVCESTITVKSILSLDAEYAVPLALTEFASQFPFGSANPYHFAHEIGLTNSTP